MRLEKIDEALKEKFRNDFPCLLEIFESSEKFSNFTNWTKICISALNPDLFKHEKNYGKLEEFLKDDAFVARKAQNIDCFTKDIISCNDFYEVGSACDFDPDKVDHDYDDTYDLVDIYEKIYEIREKNFNYKYHMPKFGVPRYILLIPYLNAVYCESFDLINVFYIKKDDKNIELINGMAKNYDFYVY